MTHKDGLRSIIGFVALLGLSSGVLGADVKVGLRDYTMIENTKGEARLLFRHDTVSLPESAVLGSAVLEIPYSASISAKTLEIVVYPVTKAWTFGSVDWSSGWNTAGGDIDEDYGSRVDIDMSLAGTATIDVTSMLKQTLEEGIFADGFLLSVPSFAGEAIPLDRAAGLDVTGGTLRVSYRLVGHGPNASRSTKRTR